MHLCLENFAHHHSTLELIQLAPFNWNGFDDETPSSGAMKRQQSPTSATDSPKLSYYGSSQCGWSNAPTKARLPYSPTTEPAFDGARCQLCLTYGQANEPYVKCHTSQRWTRKAACKKRQDRLLYSKLTSGGVKPPGKKTKNQTEAGNRFDHTTLMGNLQRQLLSLNPRLDVEARIGDGRKKQGWKRLKPNNVSKDVAVPLSYNKGDVLMSGLQVMKDTDEITKSCRDRENE